MKQNNQIIGKILYGMLFLFLFPALLWIWAKSTESIIPFPAIESKPAGGMLILSGVSLMLWGMYALYFYGKGLPMNAYPPPVLVTRGPYRLFRHPIYWGFGLLMIGYFIYAGSASGIWLVSPLTVLGMVALVLGHESIDLLKRFPDQSIRTILDYPENRKDQANLHDRITSLFWVGSYLVLSNFMMAKLNGTAFTVLEKPLTDFTGLENFLIPILSVVFILATPFILQGKDILREWEVTSFIAISVATFIGFLYPETGTSYFTGKVSVLLSIPLFLQFISLKALFRQSAKMTVFFTLVVSSLVVFQWINNQQVWLNLASSVLIFLLSANYLSIWIFLKNTAERIANSWKEWVFGKIRVINHGFYVGFGGFLGVFLAGILAGREYALALLIFTVIVSICAALWAQMIEGSAKLKRPFGYYGGIVGIIFGSLAVWIMGLNVWVVIGVASVVMPWTQAIGRLRCLVNGCCHGRKIDNPLVGIRYYHPRSRVCHISELKGELVHPTQLYAILWLFGVGILLFTLWNNGCSAPLIFGLYLILTSLGRFVEEAYRGEVQTPVLGGLHLYQWTAITSLMAGIFMTTIQTEPAVIQPGYNWESLLAAFICGLFVFFAMGVDFPTSNARFSRLV